MAQFRQACLPGTIYRAPTKKREEVCSASILLAFLNHGGRYKPAVDGVVLPSICAGPAAAGPYEVTSKPPAGCRRYEDQYPVGIARLLMYAPLRGDSFQT